jgi:DNA topoisomerase VI subunit A
VVSEEAVAGGDQADALELDALANKDFQYLTKRYLPRKLKEKDWLD